MLFVNNDKILFSGVPTEAKGAKTFSDHCPVSPSTSTSFLLLYNCQSVFRRFFLAFVPKMPCYFKAMG